MKTTQPKQNPRPPTQRQEAILSFLREHHQQQGYWPSIREIQQQFGFKSTNAVMGHLHALENKGYLSRICGHARAYQLNIPESLPPGALSLSTIPLYGSIPAGYPDGVETSGEIGRLQIDSDTLSRNRSRRAFALRVRGDSMIEAGILDGDTVIIDPVPAKQGDIVAALIDGETTLKRLVHENNCLHLKAENKSYPNLLPVTELIIQGVARSILRAI